MATSTVQIRKDDKIQLERLHQRPAETTDEKPTPQETVHTVLPFATTNKDDLLRQHAGNPCTKTKPIVGWRKPTTSGLGPSTTSTRSFTGKARTSDPSASTAS